MFEEMGKAGLTDIFPRTAYVIRHIHVYQWIRMVLMQNNGQAVIQRIFFVGDMDLLLLHRNGCLLSRLLRLTSA